MPTLQYCREAKGARKMTVTSGQRCLELSKNYGPLGLLEKMLLTSPIWNSTVRYLTWRASNTKRGHLYYQLYPSGRSINEKRTFIVANSNSKRWECLDEGQKGGCIREFAEGIEIQEWQTRGYNPNDLLSAGAREIATGNHRFQRNDDGISEGGGPT